MAISSMLASMTDWSTPTVLFCVLNLMIATIFLVSNFKSPNHHNIPSQLARSPSLLERVKSVNLSSFYTTTTESHDQYHTTEFYNSSSQLSHAPSLLQRVKSIDFSFSSFHNSFCSESEQLSNSPTEGARTLSFKLTSPFNSDQHIDRHQDEVEENNATSGELHYNKLANVVSENTDVALANRSSSKLTNSGSKKKATTSGEDDVDWRHAATKKAVVMRGHDESVDTKADDFIKRFKQQLKLQRLDSLQRLREMMMNRGTSSA